MKHIYEGHLGSLYATDHIQNSEEMYCDECGDSDWLLGSASTREEAWELLKDVTDIDYGSGWDYDYIQEFLDEHF